MLNKVILMGRLTKDPELKYTANNIAVVSFTIAVDRNFARQGEQRQTDFINIVAWRTTAEFVAKYFTKGQLLALSGSIQTRTWDATRVDSSMIGKADRVLVDAPCSGLGGIRRKPEIKYKNMPPMPKQSQPAAQPQPSADFEIIPDDDELPF